MTKGLLNATCHIMTIYHLFCLSILFTHIYGREYFIPLGPALSPRQSHLWWMRWRRNRFSSQ